MTFRDLGETKQENKNLWKKFSPTFCGLLFFVVVVVTDHLLIYFASVWSGPFFLSLTSLCLYIFRLLYDSSLCFFSLFHLCVCVCVHLFLHSLFAGAVSSVCLFGCMCVLCLHKSKKCFCVYVFHRFAYMLLVFNIIQLIKNNLNKNNKIKT